MSVTCVLLLPLSSRTFSIKGSIFLQTQFLDFDRGAIMTRTEFSTAIQQLRSWSAAPERARQYSSFARMAADKKQHRRVEWSAQKALQEPVTAAQTVRHGMDLTALSL